MSIMLCAGVALSTYWLSRLLLDMRKQTAVACAVSVFLVCAAMDLTLIPMNLSSKVTSVESVVTHVVDSSVVDGNSGYEAYITVDWNDGTMFSCGKDDVDRYKAGDLVNISVSYIGEDVYDIKLDNMQSSEYIPLRDSGRIYQLQMIKTSNSKTPKEEL